MINIRQVAITTILVLSFILFILPALTDSIFIKIFVFISVLALLYLYSMDPSDSSTKIDRSLEGVGNTPKINNVKPIPTASIPSAGISGKTTQSKPSSKAGWCFVGEDRGFRSCVSVNESQTCMSGDIFPTRDICINPGLRE